MIITTRFVPAGFDAITVWPVVLVRPAKRSDRGLIEHELVHYREQAWCTPLWWLLYLLPSFRLAAERRAYLRQIAVGGITRELAAHYLTRYHTGVTYSAALALLR